MKKIAVAIATFAAVASTPAFAQVSPGAEIFVGPIVGYDSVKVSVGDYSESEGDVMYGVVAGVDVNVGSAFVGVEGEWSDSEVGVSDDNVFGAGDSVSIEAGRTIYVGGRIGTNLGAAKVYVKGGYIDTKIEGTYDDSFNVYEDSMNLDGWVLGAGVQAKLSPVVLRLEYRYANYGEVEVLGIDTGIDATRHQVVLGALFAF